MKLVLIPPLTYLKEIANQKFHLILPHLLENPRYAQYVNDLSQDTSRYIILDNSLAEERQIEPIALIAIGSYYGVDELVVPDIMGDSRGSVEVAEAFVRVLRGQQDNHPYINKLAFVAQGQTIEETLTCAYEYLDCPAMGKYVSTIMIPRRLVTTEQPHARLAVAEQLYMHLGSINDRIDIHLLGASSHWPREVQLAAREFPFIRSMDTSMPFVYAMHGLTVETALTPPHRDGDMDYWSWEPGPEQRQLVKYNIKAMQKWVAGE